MIQEIFKMLNQYIVDIPTLPVNLCLSVNTTPQMTYFLGVKCVHKITTGKSYDELLQQDIKMRIWARSENSEKWNIYEWVTKHYANDNDNIYACVTLHDTNVNDNMYACVAPHDAYTCNHIHWASCAFS